MNLLFKSSDGDLRWGWKTAVLILGTILFGVILTTALMTALTIGYSAQGLAQAQAMETATIVSGGLPAQVILSVLQMGFMLWLVRWLVTTVEKRKFNWSELGLVSAHRSSHIWQGISLAVLLSLCTIVIGMYAGTLKYQGFGFELFAPTQVWITLFLGLVLALATGFSEEIAFRGYLQTRIAQRTHPTAAILIVAVLFALSHPFGERGNPLLYLASATLVGVLFGTIFVRTGSLWMGVSLHAAWNFLQIAILSIPNSIDGRFFGAPLFAFDNVSSAQQMLIEFAVILLGVLSMVWITKPVTKNALTKG